MSLILWDSSGLVKRYVFETGSATVNALFAYIGTITMLVPYMCYAETCSTLRRRFASSIINRTDFTQARLDIQKEILASPEVEMISVTDADMLDGVSLSDRHNINSSDSAILAGLLRHTKSRQAAGTSCVLVAADQRLLRAAQAEGLKILNPEAMLPHDLPTFLASL